MGVFGRILGYADEWLLGLGWPFSILVVAAAMAVLAVVAFVRRSLDAGGAVCAAALGVIVLWTTKFEGLLLFLLFFVGANIAGRMSKRILAKSAPHGMGPKSNVACRGAVDADSVEKKGSRRDAMQVIANGLMAAVSGLLWYVTASLPALVMFGASIAEAASDTFAGEVGRLSKVPPVSIRTFTPVPKGLSGGVTLLGTFAAFASSLAIGVLWFLLFNVKDGLVASSVICFTGFLGCIVDSYLGACVQAQYRDPDTGMLTERDSKDERPFELVRGIRWMDNDMVNLLSNVISALFAFGMASLIF